MFGPHDSSLFPFVVSDQEVDKRLRNLFLSLCCFGLIATFAKIKIVWSQMFFSDWCRSIKERLFLGLDILQVVQMQFLMIDFREVLSIKDLIH